MKPKRTAAGNQPYLVESIARACDILAAFRVEGERLRLRDLALRARLHKATALRIVSTLQMRGLITKEGRYEYKLAIRPLTKRTYRLGYATQSSEFAFSREVTESVAQSAARAGIDLVLLDNHYSANTALRNAQIFIRERVELVMEFQTDAHVAPVLASKFSELKIPLIAIEIPHPGAIYFGANNYQAGLIGGRYLGRWAKQFWGGHLDEVLLLELPMAGPLPRSRLTGSLAGIREMLPHLEDSQVKVIDTNGRFSNSLETLRRYLRRSGKKRVLVSAINDPAALAAVRAFEEAGRSEQCAVMGHNGSPEARAELRQKGTRLIGSVAYFPERYGDGLIPLAVQILEKKPVPRTVFVKHQLITPANVDHLYPNDALLDPAEAVSLL